jgi:predicted  nucleic acid-binding Zn-ribbon protein
MPHQCIECGRTFPDGSKEMLTGCPECNGNKFQFRPEGRPEVASEASTSASTQESTSTPPPVADDASSAADEPPVLSEDSSNPRVEPPRDTGDAVASADGVAVDTSTATEASGDSAAGSHTTASDTDVSEDSAQASARTDVVTRAELDRVREDTVETDEPADTSQRPAADDLREELNDQFESIKILSPGQYELNLMELYDRQEYIISLKEDGRYVIEMPGMWGDSE